MKPVQQINRKRSKRIITFIILAALAVISAFLFVAWGLNEKNIAYNLPRRLQKIAAIALTGTGIATASLVFQTITNNRILTPSVMGLDSLFMLMQTAVAFFFGAEALTMSGAYSEFALSAGLMVCFSALLCTLIFSRPGQNLFVLVLVGMICGSFFSNLSSFMQTLIDPNEFLILQGKMFASFNNVNTNLLAISYVLIGGSLVYIIATSNKLDVLALGRENAISLGINYERSVFVYLILISLMIAVSTALVGPITFLGVLVVNLSRQLLGTYRHWQLALGAALLSIVMLIGGQLLVERIFRFSTTVSVIVNFVGGLYFIILLLKERRA